MLVRVLALPILMTLAQAAVVSAQDQASDENESRSTEPTPLFAGHDLLEFSLYAPWDQIKGERSDDAEDRPAELHLADGTPALPLQVRTRGNFRRRRATCPDLPPIRLNFARKEVVGTVFAEQDKVKLVTHCRGRDADEQNLLQEYLAYRVFNELSPTSFGARLARVTYVDPEKPNDAKTKYAFLIESEDELAGRLGGTFLEVPSAHPADYDRDSMLTVALFEYMVGNTDWSLVQFHNVRLLRSADMVARPVPYDFDWTGLVNAPYAKPDESVRVRSVRDRVYRGYCLEGLDYAGVASRFLEKRAAVLALADDIPGMTEDTVRDSKRYLQEFFDILDDPGRFDRQVVRGCRPLR